MSFVNFVVEEIGDGPRLQAEWAARDGSDVAAGCDRGPVQGLQPRPATLGKPMQSLHGLPAALGKGMQGLHGLP